MAVLRAHPTGQTVSHQSSTHKDLSLTTSKAAGTTRGYIFSLHRSRRRPVVFRTIVPVAETIENPRYIRIEDRFAQPTAGNEIHDCKVVVDKNVFLITAYWKEGDHRNRAVETAGKGLRWRGEIAVVQVGRLTPFYKRPKNPSCVNKAVARFVFPSSLYIWLLSLTQISS